LGSVTVARYGVGGVANIPLDRTLDGAFRHVLAVLEEILEQLTIVDHRLAEILRRGHSATVTKSDVPRGAIVLDNAPVMHR
jgi:hypothetical protein